MMQVLVAFSLADGKHSPTVEQSYQSRCMLVPATGYHATWYPLCRGMPA